MTIEKKAPTESMMRLTWKVEATAADCAVKESNGDRLRPMEEIELLRRLASNAELLLIEIEGRGVSDGRVELIE